MKEFNEGTKNRRIGHNEIARNVSLRSCDATQCLCCCLGGRAGGRVGANSLCKLVSSNHLVKDPHWQCFIVFLQLSNNNIWYYRKHRNVSHTHNILSLWAHFRDLKQLSNSHARQFFFFPTQTTHRRRRRRRRRRKHSNNGNYQKRVREARTVSPMFRRSCISSYKNGFLRCTRPETALVSEKGKKTKLVDGGWRERSQSFFAVWSTKTSTR